MCSHGSEAEHAEAVPAEAVPAEAVLAEAMAVAPAATVPALAGIFTAGPAPPRTCSAVDTVAACCELAGGC
jgi:hypothetical protein